MMHTAPKMPRANTSAAKPLPWSKGFAALAIAFGIVSLVVAACSGTAATSAEPTSVPTLPPTESAPDIVPQPTIAGVRLRSLRYDSLTPPPVAKEINGCRIEPDTQCPGVDLEGADLGAITAGSHHVARRAADLSGGNFKGANFEGAYMARVELDGADLSDVNFRGTNLHQSSLFEADLSGADLTDADLGFADMEDAVIDGAIFCRTTMPDTSVNSSGCP